MLARFGVRKRVPTSHRTGLGFGRILQRLINHPDQLLQRSCKWACLVDGNGPCSSNLLLDHHAARKQAIGLSHHRRLVHPDGLGEIRKRSRTIGEEKEFDQQVSLGVGSQDWQD